MRTISISATIHAPAAAIREVFTDYEHADQWFPLHRGWPDGPPPRLAKGAQFRQRLAVMGLSDTVSFTVVELDAATFAVAGIAGLGTRLELTVSIEARDEHSDVTLAFAVAGLPLPRLIQDRIERRVIRDLSATLEGVGHFARRIGKVDVHPSGLQGFSP